MHQITDLITLFDDTFYQRYNTRLIKGDLEPIYIPADGTIPYHQIIFAHGYYASALHEIAHWLVAGEKRRKIEDFGYWYCPDGRDEKKQAEFENVEVKPQAIEWLLSCSAKFKFNVSADNLSGAPSNRVAFQARVHAQVLSLLKNGCNERTQLFLKVLSDFYKSTWPLNETQFNY